jgi:hypothetical protein
MSTKTLRKRIALVAVTALGAGLLSVVAVPSANAVAAGYLTLVSTNQCAANDDTSGALITANNTQTTIATGKTVTLVLGTQFTVQGADSEYIQIKGSSVAVATLPSNHVTSVNSKGYLTVTNHTTAAAVTFTATALGTTSFTGGVAATTTATLLNTMNVTVVASCSKTFDAANSSVSTTNSSTDATFLTNENVDEHVIASAGSPLVVRIKGLDGYGNALSTGTFAASATNGALLAWSSAIGTAASTGTNSTATITDDSNGEVALKVYPADDAVGGSTIVTITFNGSPVATKNLTFLGEATKISVVLNLSGTLGSVGALGVILTDSTGRQIPGSVTMDALSASAQTTGITEAYAASPLAPQTPSGGYASFAALGSIGYGLYTFTCTAGTASGSTTIKLKHTSDVNENKLTLDVPVSCAAGVDKFSVSMDKASYKIGEIATMTISATDSYGKAVSDLTAVGSGATVSAGGMSQVGALSTADTFTGGKRTYTFQVTTAGTFNASVAIAGLTTKTATAGYSVTGGDVAMSEVLKAIVSLIASINKQIAALQKALLKK